MTPVTFRIRPIVAAALLCMVVAGPLAWDLSRPPARQASARAAISAIRWYQANWAKRLHTQCRFTPTCSHYAIAVIERHGLLGGGWLTAVRLARCGPWTPAGTVDLPR